jgi:hypothetical protein
MTRKEHALISDVETLIHPSQVFDRPSQVVNDPDLSLNEKRAILASWASDACAIEAAPALRRGRAGRTIQFDEIMDALRVLDKQIHAADVRSKDIRRPLVARKGGSGRNDQGSPLQ